MEIVARQSTRESPVRGRTVDCCFGRSLSSCRRVRGRSRPEGVHRAHLNTKTVKLMATHLPPT